MIFPICLSCKGVSPLADVKITRQLYDMIEAYHNPGSDRYHDPALEKGIQIRLAEKARKMAIHEANSITYQAYHN